MAFFKGIIISILMMTTFISGSLKSPFDGTKPIYPKSSAVTVISSADAAYDDTYKVSVFTSFEEWESWYSTVHPSYNYKEYDKYNSTDYFENNNLVMISVGRATIYELYIKEITEKDDTLVVDCGAYWAIDTTSPYTYTKDIILISTSKNISQADVSYDHVRSVIGI